MYVIARTPMDVWWGGRQGVVPCPCISYLENSTLCGLTVLAVDDKLFQQHKDSNNVGHTRPRGKAAKKCYQRDNNQRSMVRKTLLWVWAVPPPPFHTLPYQCTAMCPPYGGTSSGTTGPVGVLETAFSLTCMLGSGRLGPYMSQPGHALEEDR